MSNWAIVIGINEYSHPKLRLNGAVNDALEMRKWLRSPDGGNVPAENLFLLLSDDDDSHLPPNTEEATNRNIIWATQELVRKSGGHGDRLFFYFAGHGLANYEYGEQEAICSSDFDLNMPNLATISIDSITKYLETIQFSEQYIFFDACRNIPFKECFRIGHFSNAPIRDLRLPPVQQFIFYATSPGLTATEMGFAGNEQGAFTKSLLDGLRGKGKAKIYDPMNDKYVIKADRLIEFLREEVKKALTNGDVENFIHYPRLSGERDRSTVLVGFPSTAFPNVDLDVFIEPSTIASQVEIGIRGGTAVPSQKATSLPVKFNLPESDYGVLAVADQYEPTRRPWPVELYSQQSLTIKMIKKIPTKGTDPSTLLGSNTTLSIDSTDRFAPLEITDVVGNVEAAGVGSLYLSAKPGLYRLKLFSSDGQTYEKLVALEEGEQKKITMQPTNTPTISSGIIQKTGFKVLDDNTLLISEDMEPVTGPKIATVLALASRVTDHPEIEWPAKELRKMGLQGFKKLTNSARNGLHLLVSNDAQDGEASGGFIEELKIRFWSINDPISPTPKKLLPSSISDFVEFAMEAAPGSYWISFESENRQPVVFSLAVLPGRITLVILQRNKDGKITVFQYLPRSSGTSQYEEISHVRIADTLQQYYASDISDYVYEDVLRLAGGKQEDPNAGAVAAFLMFKNMNKREQHTLQIISGNMTYYFGQMPDSFVLKAKLQEILNSRDASIDSYKSALERGVPIFSEGLASLYDAIKKYDLNENPHANLVKSAFEQRISGTIWSCWIPTKFNPGQFIE